ncbi:MAG: hypothetical protein QOE59_1210 [Actinomycetota bacterium]|nr:hypothetical protein [Actinomycetota bacterium]
MIHDPTRRHRTGRAADLEAHERSRYRAAAEHARRTLPGPLGELASRELAAAADFGHRLGRDALIASLATDILAGQHRPVTAAD